MEGDLNYYFNLHKSDKGDDPSLGGNHYASWYEKFLYSRRDDIKNICEIGINNGASLKALYDYFPNALILGLDIKTKKEYENKRISTQILDQSQRPELDNFVKSCIQSNLTFDLIIDDGSHDVSHQQSTFGKMFKLLNPHGIYIIEDMGTSYFKVGESLYGYTQTEEKLSNNSVSFLLNRPFTSPWIEKDDLKLINKEVKDISIFDKTNPLPYKFKCVNDYPIRSITSIIQKI
tara:strand:+ start:3670 stop:4368 length:699 start_codon:yes stop_codon:yes gene_type:complete